MVVDRIWVYKRARGLCESCRKAVSYEDFDRHHIYRKSQYKYDDRNEEWNGACLCHKCHMTIHNGNIWLDKRLKAEADIRKPEHLRSKVLLKNLTPKKKVSSYEKDKAKEYKKQQIEHFKKTHDWLSPSQYQYRKQKEYYRKISWQNK